MLKIEYPFFLPCHVAGIAKHFQMACILEKFSSAVKRVDISSQVIWDRLDTMYDMQALVCSRPGVFSISA